MKRTADSLAEAGFDEPMIVKDCHTKPRHILNWKKGFEWLVAKDADRYAVFQDDVLACVNLREYLEQMTYPYRSFLNLITFDGNTRPGSVGWHPSRQRGKGAQGLVFDRESALALRTSEQYKYPSKLSGTEKSIDGMVATGLRSLGFTEYVHTPSLLQHVGEKSTLGHNLGPAPSWQEGYDPCASMA